MPGSLERAVKDVWDDVRHEFRTKKMKLWKDIQRNHIIQVRKINRYSRPRLPATSVGHDNGSKSAETTVTINNFTTKTNKKQFEDFKVKTASIESSHPPLPRSRTAILQNYSYMVDDEVTMKFIPNLDEGVNQEVDELLEELVELGAQVKTYEYGKPHEEKRFLIETTLKRLDEKQVLPQQINERERYYANISKLSDVDKDRIKDCHRQHHVDREQTFDFRRKHKNSDTPMRVSYDKIIDSYRDLFCRFCFTFDCNIHGNLPKAPIELLVELALNKEREGKWAEIDGNVTSIDQANRQESIAFHGSDELSPVQQSICEHFYVMFQGDIEKMALVMGASTKTVQSFVTLNKIKLLNDPKYVTPTLLKRKSDRVPNLYVSMRNYKPEYLSKIQSTFIHPAFIPCDHDEPCNQANCSCIKNAFFCTKHCSWGSMSTNFFRGCACKAGQCRLSNCACYAAKRECDPDLCRSCGACTDSPNAPAGDGQRCRNDNMSMKRGVRLLVGVSNVEGAGLGLFTQHALNKGDFVDEYVGEIMSQEEAERRGVVYDRQNMSYLFNLCSDFSVDATVKGNKTRYANHSDAPNIEPRLIRVNGVSRIGFFAIKDIGAQEELFFDYGYTVEIDNEQLFKPNHAHKFHWMSSNKKSKP